MKTHRKRIQKTLILFALVPMLVLTVLLSSAMQVQAGDTIYGELYFDGKEVDIIFFHDVHSHIDSFPTVQDGKSVISGGFAGIKTIIDDARKDNPDTLVLDAGDFSMGTLIQTIYREEAAELRSLGAIGCDVSTLGNHEFDFRSEGLAAALGAAKASGDPLPSLVLCNIDWETMEAEGLTEEQKLLKEAFDAYGIQDYTILTRGDVRIAVFGVFGKDSLACAPTCVLKFRDAAEAAADTVARIKMHEKADMIVCVSHSGTGPDTEKSEDELLAQKVPEIDFIVSGHSHTTLNEPIVCGNTYIGSCGEYARSIGKVSLRQTPQGRWEMAHYELVPVTENIPGDPEIQAMTDAYFEIVDASYLSQFGYTRKQVLAHNDVVFSTSPDLYNMHTDHNLGNLLSDAFYTVVNNSGTGDTHPVDVAVVPAGCVRDTFAVGDITVEDVFNAYSTGIGPDGIPTYPLISIYLTGAELRLCAEIDASISDLMVGARLYMRGMNFSYHPNRMILNKVNDCYLEAADGTRTELEDKTLYRVVCDLYSGQMLGNVTDLSYGLLKIQPKFADGTLITDIEDAIIYVDGKELKAWTTIASYIGSFEDTDNDGIGEVPASYSELHGRKVVDDRTGIGVYLESPNKFSIIIFCVLLTIVILIGLVIRFIIRRITRKRRQKQ